MDEKEARKQQRRNELLAKQERLRKLKEQNRTEATSRGTGAGGASV